MRSRRSSEPKASSEPPNDGISIMRGTAHHVRMNYRFYYAGIRVRNLTRSMTFYRKALRMKVVNEGTMSHGGKYVHLVGPGSKQRLELNWYPDGSRFHTPYRRGDEMDHLAFVVADVRKAYAELIRKGAKPGISPEKAKGLEVYVKDPDGIWIELLQG